MLIVIWRVGVSSTISKMNTGWHSYLITNWWCLNERLFLGFDAEVVQDGARRDYPVNGITHTIHSDSGLLPRVFCSRRFVSVMK